MAVFATNIAMLGDTEVGKSSIVLQLCDHKFSEGIISTVGESISLYFSLSTISIVFPWKTVSSALVNLQMLWSKTSIIGHIQILLA